MWAYRRIFTFILACCLVFGFVYFIRIQVNFIDRRPAAPAFFPNVARYRTSRVCSTRAIVLVNSKPEGSRRRQVIRETWGHPRVTQSLDISIAFGIAAADNNDVQRSLDWEAEIYGDIFQIDVAHSRIQSSTKVMEMLKTARSACTPLPEFVLKTEDDVFLNTLFLGEMLESIETYSSSNTMWCLEWNSKLDKPRNISTWTVMQTHYNPDNHPSYCIGTVYLMTGRAVDAVIRRHDAQTIRTQLPEEVYVTDVLTKEAGIKLLFLGHRFEFQDVEQIDVQKVAFVYLGEQVEDYIRKMWKVLAKDKLKESRRSDIGL